MAGTHSHSERRVTESRVLLLVKTPTYEKRATVEKSNFTEMTEAFAIEIGRREHHDDRSKVPVTPGGGGGGGYSSEFLVGVCRPGLPIPTLFQT